MNIFRKKQTGIRHHENGLLFLDLTTTWAFDAKTGQCLGHFRAIENRRWYVVCVFGEDGLLIDAGPINGIRDVTFRLQKQRE